MTRRDFLGRCAAASAAALLPPGARGDGSEAKLTGDWSAMLEDPVRKMFPGQPDLDKILTLFPRTTGEPAFDPALIARNVKELRTNPPVQTGHPFLDLSVQTGLAHIDATFQGDRPRYGVQSYGAKVHDAFPPTIIAAVDALSAWGIHDRAARLFRYWLAHFVRDDGTINYYGPSLSEYGQLLHTAALLAERAGTAGWWQEGFPVLDRMAEYLLRLRAAAVPEDGLLSGVPEADTRKETGKYFHNNAWVAKGLERWAELCRRQNASPSTPIARVRQVAADLRRDTLRAIQQTWPADPSDWWLPPRVGPLDPQKPSRLNGAGASGLTAYTNYRYWPELLSSGLLPKHMANRIVEARLGRGAVLRHDALQRPPGRLAIGGLPGGPVVAGAQE